MRHHPVQHPAGDGSVDRRRDVRGMAREGWVRYCKESSGDLEYLARLVDEGGAARPQGLRGRGAERRRRRMRIGRGRAGPGLRQHRAETVSPPLRGRRPGRRRRGGPPPGADPELVEAMVLGGPCWLSGPMYALGRWGSARGTPVSPLEPAGAEQAARIDAILSTSDQAYGAPRMKIVRYLDPAGQVHHGRLHPDGSTTRARRRPLRRPPRHRRAGAASPSCSRRSCPADILCIGLNYRKHAEEGKQAIPEWPVLFMKNGGALQNPGDPIVLPTQPARATRSTTSASWPSSSARRARTSSKADALDYVLGYTCANDVSARDWQMKKGGSQWCRGKTFATFAPLGPCLVTADEIPNPNALEDPDDPQRPGHAGLEHRRHDLRRADPDRVPQRQHAAPARHGDPDRHAPRRRRGAEAAGLPPAGRHGDGRDRGDRRADQPGRRRGRPDPGRWPGARPMATATRTDGDRDPTRRGRRPRRCWRSTGRCRRSADARSTWRAPTSGA